MLYLALLGRAFANFTATAHQRPEQLRIAFAPHPFLSHWAVSAPIARELLQRDHKALVLLFAYSWFRSKLRVKSAHLYLFDLRKH